MSLMQLFVLMAKAIALGLGLSVLMVGLTVCAAWLYAGLARQPLVRKDPRS
jgi:hypothetical protein